MCVNVCVCLLQSHLELAGQAVVPDMMYKTLDIFNPHNAKLLAATAAGMLPLYLSCFRPHHPLPLLLFLLILPVQLFPLPPSCFSSSFWYLLLTIFWCLLLTLWFSSCFWFLLFVLQLLCREMVKGNVLYRKCLQSL